MQPPPLPFDDEPAGGGRGGGGGVMVKMNSTGLGSESTQSFSNPPHEREEGLES
jgi:hypothetical protein